MLPFHVGPPVAYWVKRYEYACLSGCQPAIFTYSSMRDIIIILNMNRVVTIHKESEIVGCVVAGDSADHCGGRHRAPPTWHTASSTSSELTSIDICEDHRGSRWWNTISLARCHYYCCGAHLPLGKCLQMKIIVWQRKNKFVSISTNTHKHRGDIDWVFLAVVSFLGIAAMSFRCSSTKYCSSLSSATSCCQSIKVHDDAANIHANTHIQPDQNSFQTWCKRTKKIVKKTNSPIVAVVSDVS